MSDTHRFNLSALELDFSGPAGHLEAVVLSVSGKPLACGGWRAAAKESEVVGSDFRSSWLMSG